MIYTLTNTPSKKSRKAFEAKVRKDIENISVKKHKKFLGKLLDLVLEADKEGYVVAVLTLSAYLRAVSSSTELEFLSFVDLYVKVQNAASSPAPPPVDKSKLH